jgi:lipopolysaccharide biosynthesis glycosyltransferase
LRANGNAEQVLAIGYGLYPSEANALSRLPNLQLQTAPNNGQMVPVRRLQDFARLTSALDANTPVAYWDVGDVLFQDSLKPLWNLILENPGKLLAVAEPKGYPHNAVIPAWSLSIRDQDARLRTFSLLKSNPFLNSGFAAGSAEAMHAYFTRGEAMLKGSELLGTSDWGDQMALNIYCHSDPSRWISIDQRWNYCVHDRAVGEVYIGERSRVCSKRNPNLAVIHGNARSLRQFGLVMA